MTYIDDIIAEVSDTGQGAQVHSDIQIHRHGFKSTAIDDMHLHRLFVSSTIARRPMPIVHRRRPRTSGVLVTHTSGTVYTIVKGKKNDSKSDTKVGFSVTHTRLNKAMHVQESIHTTIPSLLTCHPIEELRVNCKGNDPLWTKIPSGLFPDVGGHQLSSGPWPSIEEQGPLEKLSLKGTANVSHRASLMNWTSLSWSREHVICKWLKDSRLKAKRGYYNALTYVGMHMKPLLLYLPFALSFHLLHLDHAPAKSGILNIRIAKTWDFVENLDDRLSIYNRLPIFTWYWNGDGVHENQAENPVKCWAFQPDVREIWRHIGEEVAMGVDRGRIAIEVLMRYSNGGGTLIWYHKQTKMIIPTRVSRLVMEAYKCFTNLTSSCVLPLCFCFFLNNYHTKTQLAKELGNYKLFRGFWNQNVQENTKFLFLLENQKKENSLI
ncbi:hypothetical protein LXL04_009241 [Taraxacum kok-saghyz]